MKLVVIGGDAAGMSAASQARKRLGPGELEIVAFERGHFTSYSACGIPYWIGGAVKDRDALIARTPREFRDAGISVHTPTRSSASTWPPAKSWPATWTAAANGGRATTTWCTRPARC